jgi:hypothetical protein
MGHPGPGAECRGWGTRPLRRENSLVERVDGNASARERDPLQGDARVKNIDIERDSFERRRLNVFGVALIALLVNLFSTELHECMHLIVGRLCGLPAHFLSLTSVGVDPLTAANASPSALALMNGVAPLTTMLVGIAALYATPGLRRRAPAAITSFVAWCAIFAVPYIGLQIMTTALPARLRGNGADSAAVIGGYFGAPLGVRTVISVVGLMIFMASGFFLGRAVSDDPDDALCRLRLRQRLRGLAPWRVGAASALGLLLIGLVPRGAFMLAHGNGGGFFVLLMAIWVWGAMMTLLVRWRAPGARDVRDQWIFPGILASLGMLAISWFTHLDDFFTSATIFVIPLIATAWVLTRESARNAG